MEDQIIEDIEANKKTPDGKTMRKSTMIEKSFEVFMFCNPKSGSQQAKRFLKLDFEACTMTFSP